MDVIGTGAYAIVLESADHKYAIKRINRLHILSAQREILIMSMFNHENINKIESVAFGPEFIEIKMKKYSCNLLQYMKNPLNTTPSGLLLLRDIFNFARDLCAGIAEIHRVGIIHGDIKPQNLLVSTFGQNVQLVICDFGVSVPTDELLHLPTVQTCTYRAPEVHLMSNRLKYTSKIDMWSVGCVLYELATNRPFSEFDTNVSDSTVYACRSLGVFCDTRRLNRVKMLNAVTKNHIVHILNLTIQCEYHESLFSMGYIHTIALCLYPNTIKRITSVDALNIMQGILVKYTNDGRVDNRVAFNILDNVQRPVYSMNEMNCLHNVDSKIISQCSIECLCYAEYIYRRTRDCFQMSQIYNLACIYIAISVYSGSMRANGLIRCNIDQLYDSVVRIFNEVLCPFKNDTAVKIEKKKNCTLAKY